MERKLPAGLRAFGTIRKEGCPRAGKTADAHRIRPRPARERELAPRTDGYFGFWLA